MQSIGQEYHNSLAVDSVCQLLVPLMLLCLFRVSLPCGNRFPALALVLCLSVILRDERSAAGENVFNEEVSPPADMGYWVVSTHESPQSFRRQSPRFRPRVTRVASCRHSRSSSFTDLCQSFVAGVPVCIFTHGSFLGTHEMEVQFRRTNQWLRSASGGQPLQLINFAWPSGRPLRIPRVNLDVNLLGRRAARNGWYLAELIRHIPPDCPICLIGHSHGSRLIASALHLMGGGIVQGVRHRHVQVNGRRIRVVFAASAMRHDWLNPGERYGRALCATSCVLNLKNRHDPALMLYPLRHPFSGHSLGTRGFTRRDRKSLGSWSPKVQDCDVTLLIGYSHMWPLYLEHQRLAWLIRNFVFFSETQTNGVASADSQSDSGFCEYQVGHVESVDEPG